MNLKTVIVFAMLGLLGAPGCKSSSDRAKKSLHDSGASRSNTVLRATSIPPAVDDASLYASLIKGGTELLNSGQTTKTEVLIAQLKRKTCQAKLTAKPGVAPLQNSRLYAQSKGGVLIFAGLFKCKQCPDWHAGCSSGFVLTEDGVAVTNYHVVDHPDSTTLVAATADGLILPVKAVLAASEADDIAILQLGGDRLQPLPLQADAPVGSKVCVIGHPSGMFYTLSEGIVSRYFRQQVKQDTVVRMAVTADFAIGSSGGPVFDPCGNAVGMVAATESIYFTHTNGVNDNLQMVLKYCVPISAVLKLIEPTRP